jgi:hypothetical protein
MINDCEIISVEIQSVYVITDKEEIKRHLEEYQKEKNDEIEEIARKTRIRA